MFCSGTSNLINTVIKNRKTAKQNDRPFFKPLQECRFMAAVIKKQPPEPLSFNTLVYIIAYISLFFDSLV